MTINDSLTDHIVTLTGLTAATQYYYQIESSNIGGSITEGAEADYYFKTYPTPGAQVPTRLWVIGDSGTNNANQDNVYNAYRTRTGTAHTDAWLMLGDNAYNSGTDGEFQGAVFDAYPELLRNTTMWSCIGNHETYTNSGSPYLDIHSFPTAGECGGVASGSEHYYSYDHGNIHFVCLDSATSNISDTPGSGGMIDWLEMDLQATNKDWIIAYFHHGPYTKGSHNSDIESRHIEARRYMTPLLEAYGVDLVLSGHSHCYERSMLVNGHHSNMSAEDSRSSTFDSNSHVIDGGNGSSLGSIDGNGNFVTDGGEGAYLKELGSTRSGTIYSICGASGKLSGWANGSTATVNPDPHPVFVVNLRTLGSMIIHVDGTTLNAQYLDDNNVVRDDFTIVKLDTVVNNLPPVIGDAGFALAENASVSTIVGVVTGTDPDVGDVLTYSISGGNTGSVFLVNSSTGEITTAAALDYETAAQYLLTVTVTDDGSPALSDTASVTIDLLDINEAPSLADITGGAGEPDQPYSDSIGGTGSDPDSGDMLTYGKVSGPLWLTIDLDGTLSGTPANEDIGTNVWTVRVTDSDGLTADAKLNIAVDAAPSGPISVSASGETTSRGTSSGGLTQTTSSDNNYETLTEEVSGGNPRKKRSQLDHQWTFANVPGGSSATLRVEAHHTQNSEGDDFVFAYSTDGATFTNVLTVTKTSDNNVEQTAPLPLNLSGTVFVRVTDTDNSQGNSVADSLFVDLLAIDVTSGSGPPLAAGNPSPANGIDGITLNPVLTWSAGGGANSYQVYFGTTAPGDAQGSQTELSFEPGALATLITYYWRVDSINSNGITTGTVWNFTTGSGASSSLFFDDFEDGNLDGWSTTGSVSAHPTAANSGVYGARLRAAAEIMITLDTTGLTGVNLKYDRTTSKFNPNETLDVEWSLDGSTWNLIESTSATIWETTNVPLPAAAAGQSTLQIRFKANANSNKGEGYLDNVNIIGR